MAEIEVSDGVAERRFLEQHFREKETKLQETFVDRQKALLALIAKQKAQIAALTANQASLTAKLDATKKTLAEAQTAAQMATDDDATRWNRKGSPRASAPSPRCSRRSTGPRFPPANSPATSTQCSSDSPTTRRAARSCARRSRTP